MGILSRYILKEILKAFIPLWIGLSFFGMLVEWLGRAFKLHATLMTSVLAFVYKIPFYLQLVFPVALVVSTVVVFRSMNRNREIVALESLGVRYRDLLAPLLITVLLTGLPFLLISMEIAPRGLKQHLMLYSDMKGTKQSYIGQLKKEKIWYRSGDVLYNVGFYDAKKQELLDVSIYEFDPDFQLGQITTAKRAIWNGHTWVLMNVSQIFVGPELEQAGREDFSSLENNILERPTDLVRFDFNPDVLTENELLNIIKRYQQMGINTSAWETTFHSRISFLALSFILMLLALPKTLVFRRTNNLAKDLTFITIFSLFLWIVYSMCLSLGAEGRIAPPLAAWGPVALLFIYAMFGIVRLNLKGQSE